MNTRLLFSGVVRTMARYWLRTFFMSLGIVLGVAFLVVTRSMGAGVEEAMLEKVERLFNPSNILVGAGSNALERPKEGPVTTLTKADIEAIDEILETVIDWDPYQMLRGQDAKYGSKSRQVKIFGHSERAETVWNRSVTTGAFFDEHDVRSVARVALLGPKTAEYLFGEEDPIGKQIQIGKIIFRVKGVLESIGMDPHGIDRDDEIQVPITTLMRRMMNVDFIMAAKLIVDDPSRVEDTADRVTEILRERHSIAPDEADDFSLITPALVQELVGKANRVFKVFLPASAVLALLVAAIVIANIMLLSVKARMVEIGLRKAMGATDMQIQLQFLAETVTVSVLSGILGAILGAVLLMLIAEHTGMELVATTDAMGMGLVAATAVGVLSGFIPARNAARLDPVSVLR